MTNIFPKELCDKFYTSCYCEENVWKICQHFRELHEDEVEFCYAVFISNHNRTIPLWAQKAGNQEDAGFIVWDYHVIFIHKDQVYDLDSCLEFPSPIQKYLWETCEVRIRDQDLQSKYQRFFRVIPAKEFLNKFASDRRHMKKSDGTWMKPPPNHAAIFTDQSVHNLDSFISMKQEEGPGQVLNLSQFASKFSVSF